MSPFKMMFYGLRKVISGGQTGADFAGLAVAKAFGIETGGWAPKGFKTVAGPNPVLESYGVIETNTVSYQPRTKLNVKNSDGTVRFASNYNSPGEKLTLSYIKAAKKPHIDIPLDGGDIDVKAEELYGFICCNGIQILNVAGNADRGASTFHFDETSKILIATFKKLDRLDLLVNSRV